MMAPPKRINFLDNDDDDDDSNTEKYNQGVRNAYAENDEATLPPKKSKVVEETDDDGDDDDNDVLGIIACDIVQRMKRNILKYKNDEFVGDDDDTGDDDEEEEDVVNEVFQKFKAKLKHAFFEKYYHYTNLYEKWLEDDITRTISEQFLKNINKSSFTDKEALADALSKHKQIIYSCLKDCISDLIEDDSKTK